MSPAVKKKKALPATECDHDFFDIFFLKNRRYLLWITITGFLCYARTIGFGFSPLDDVTLIVNRLEFLSDPRHLDDLFTKGIFFADGAKTPDYYRPLLMVTFLIDTLVGRGNPAIYHLTNILMHLGSSLLCFMFLNRMLENRKYAFLFSMIYVVHPAAVVTTAWIPGRNDSLLAIFIFSSAIFYLKYLNDSHIRTSAHPHIRSFALSFAFLFYILALFTKENALLFLPLLLSLEYVRNGKFSTRTLLPAALLFTLATAGWWWMRSSIVSTMPYVEHIPSQGLIIEIVFPFLIYLQKSIIPLQQSVIPVIMDTSWILPVLVAAGLIFIFWYFGVKDTRMTVFGFVWFGIFLLVPIIQGVINREGLHFEHRIYIPLAGLLLAIAQMKIDFSKYAGYFALVVALFFIKSIVRSEVYANSFTYATAAAEESPHLAMAWNLRGTEYNNRGDFRQAIEDYTKALSLDSLHLTALYNRANSCKALGEYELAMQDYNHGLRNDTLNAQAYYHRGNLHFDLNDYLAAIRDYDRAIKLNPKYPAALNNRGNAKASLGLYKEALRDLNRSLEINPKNARAYSNRGNVWGSLGLPQKALADYDRALELKPGEKDFIQNRELLLREMQQARRPEQPKLSFLEQQLLPKALEDYRAGKYQEALNLFMKLHEEAKQANNVRSALSHYNNAGLCYMKMNQPDMAVNVFSTIILQKPDYVNAYANLGLVYKRTGNLKLAKEFYRKALELDPGNARYEREMRE